MGLFGKRTRLRPGDPSTWQMGPDGLLQGDTAVRNDPVQGYWQGGDGFSGRDGLAGALAVIGDAFAQRGGGQPMAMQGLMGNRLSAVKMAQDRAQAEQDRPPGRADISWQLSEKAKYETPDIPAAQKNYQWWDSLPPAEKAKYAQYQSVVNPKWITGADGRPQQMTGGGLPQGYDPNEWEIVEGDGGGNATGGFPPRYRR